MSINADSNVNQPQFIPNGGIGGGFGLAEASVQSVSVFEEAVASDFEPSAENPTGSPQNPDNAWQVEDLNAAEFDALMQGLDQQTRSELLAECETEEDRMLLEEYFKTLGQDGEAN